MPRLIVLAVVPLALAGLAFSILRGSPEPPVVDLSIQEPPTQSPATIVVDVVGAVARPGVVRLPEGSRVLDALLAAGGMTGEADLFAVNKATLLHDGARVYVPTRGEMVPESVASANGPTLKVNLNAASSAQLEDLPGIGPVAAGKIVRSRQERPFATVEDLQTRGLVSARVLADLRNLVTVR